MIPLNAMLYDSDSLVNQSIFHDTTEFNNIQYTIWFRTIRKQFNLYVTTESGAIQYDSDSQKTICYFMIPINLIVYYMIQIHKNDSAFDNTNESDIMHDMMQIHNLNLNQIHKKMIQ